MQEQTPKEPELAALKEVVFNSWSNSIKELPPVLRPYWNYREELSIEDSLIMKRHRIIIPQVLQGDILAKLHASHQGACTRQITVLTEFIDISYKNSLVKTG